MSDDVHDIVTLTFNQKRSCGGPTEKRFKSAYEKNIIVKCSWCGKSGHNRRMCSYLAQLSQSQSKNKEKKMRKIYNTHWPKYNNFFIFFFICWLYEMQDVKYKRIRILIQSLPIEVSNFVLIILVFLLINMLWPYWISMTCAMTSMQSLATI